jgi:hypothetical protein
VVVVHAVVVVHGLGHATAFLLQETCYLPSAFYFSSAFFFMSTEDEFLRSAFWICEVIQSLQGLDQNSGSYISHFCGDAFSHLHGSCKMHVC